MNDFPEIRFEFDKLVSTVDDLSLEWQFLLRITCNFEIQIEGRKFYRETDFPVVEFASQASDWLTVDAGDFHYDSMESGANPLIAFRRLDNDEFLAYSPHQEFEAPKRIAREALRAALTIFVDQLRVSVQGSLGIDLDRFLRFYPVGPTTPSTN